MHDVIKLELNEKNEKKFFDPKKNRSMLSASKVIGKSAGTIASSVTNYDKCLCALSCPNLSSGKDWRGHVRRGNIQLVSHPPKKVYKGKDRKTGNIVAIKKIVFI